MFTLPTGIIESSAVFLLAADQPSPAPVLPIGWLVIWWICARRKRDPIGGWLAYYYYQLYLGVVVSAFFVAVLNIHSYVPENFSGQRGLYLLFVASTLPGLILLVFQAAVATFLLLLKTWDLVGLLRKVLLATAIAEGVGLFIDAKYFPDNVGLSLVSFIPSVLWVGYFYRSDRVRRVFKTHDWEVAPKALSIA